MLTEQDIVAYVENTLSSTERIRVEAELETDEALRREVLQQLQLDRALLVSLGDAAANERVKQSVLSVLEGESEERIKQQVLKDTIRSGGRRRATVSWWDVIFRRPAWVFGMVAASLLVIAGIMISIRYAGGALAIELPASIVTATGSIVPKIGESVRIPASGSGTVRFVDGTVLHLEPGTEVRFQNLGHLSQKTGKQIQLLGGSLSAEVARQAAGEPMLIQTPHAMVTVVGTAFDLNVTTNRTALEVTHGLVNLVENYANQSVQVASGEFAVASPQSSMQYGRLARHPFTWPFSSTSIWNIPVGSGARFVPVPGRPFLADGPLVNAVRPRRPFIGGPADPLRFISVRGETVADVCLADAHLPRAGLLDSFVVLQQGRRFALEMKNVSARPDGRIEVLSVDRTDLAGPGFGDAVSEAKPFGFSNMGGLLRVGELENGIRHALSARVNRDRLAGRDFKRPVTVWPAKGNPVQNVVEPKLRIGSLMAIPPDVDIKSRIGESGPAYELARAMQDYGVYVTGTLDGSFVLLSDDMRNTEIDAILTRIVPLLRVLSNNLPGTPAGGGAPRRESAPALRDEAP
ncbi:MAG TPA: FecR family protein [Roseimicrobium sp.]|nr:FecR family protein [Roseimicrobium sp.]